MYKIYSKTEKSNATKLPFAPFSSKAGNDINCVQTVSDRKIFALSNDIIFILIQLRQKSLFYHFNICY